MEDENKNARRLRMGEANRCGGGEAELVGRI